MDDQTKAAFASATETIKNILTLSSAILTVSITFLKDVNKTPTASQVCVLETSWITLLLAVAFCIFTLMALTGSLANPSALKREDLYAWNIRIPSFAASMMFFAGIAFTAAFGFLSV